MYDMDLQDDILHAVKGLGLQQVNLGDKFEKFQAKIHTDIAEMNKQILTNCSKLDKLDKKFDSKFDELQKSLEALKKD